MDFSAWSPSHLIIAGLAFATIIGQAIAVLARLKNSTERLEKQSELFYHALNKRIDEVNQQIMGIREELRSEIRAVRDEIHDVREDLRSEMNQRFSEVHSEIRDVRIELSKLNQNHIDHLTHHQSEK